MGKQAVLTDLGNVVVTFWDRRKLVEQIVERFSGKLEDVQSLFPAGAGEDVYEAIDSGSLGFANFYQRIQEASGFKLSYVRFAMLWARHLEIIEPVAALYKRIQDRIPIIAVSNGDLGSRHAADLAQVFGGIDFFEVFVSSEHRIKKPALFGVVREFLISRGFDPTHCPYVDDMQKYVDGALDYGFPGIVFNGREQDASVLETGLQKFGIE